MIYRIRVEGLLGPGWSDWFDDLAVSPSDDGDTLLTGCLADQAALFGILHKIRDLGLTLVSVVRLGSVESPPPVGPVSVDSPEPHR